MKIAKHFVSVLFFLCFSFSSQAQGDKKSDSLIAVYNNKPKDSTKAEILHDLYDYFSNSNIDLSKKYAKEYLVVAKDYGTANQVGWAYYDLAMVHRNLGNKDSCKLFNSKAKEIFIELNYTKGIINTDKQLAILYDEEGKDDEAIKLLFQNIEKEKIRKDTLLLASDYKHLAGIYADNTKYKLALEYCLKSLKLYEQIDQPIRHADALYQMGLIEDFLGNQKNSIENYSKALEIYIEENDKQYQALTYDALGKEYFELQNYDKADKHLKKALVLAREMKSTFIEGSILSSLGSHKIKLGNLDEGITYLKSALVLAEKIESKNSFRDILYKLSEAQLLKNYDRAALDYANRGLQISRSNKSVNAISDFLKLRSKIYEKQKRTTLAFDDYKKYETIKDSLFTVEKSKQIEELRTIYDTEKKEQQIALQENEIGLLEEKEKVSNLQKIALGGGLGLSTLVIGFGFYGIRQKMQRNKLEKEKVDAELAFKKKELTTHAMHLAKKNEVLESVKQKARELKASETGERGYQQLIQTINFDQRDDRNWENFTQYFEQVHKDFGKTVKTRYPELTKNELRLMALIKMNLSSKEIANILNISVVGIKKARNRLRKKLGITPKDSLEALIISI